MLETDIFVFSSIAFALLNLFLSKYSYGVIPYAPLNSRMIWHFEYARDFIASSRVIL